MSGGAEGVYADVRQFPSRLRGRLRYGCALPAPSAAATLDDVKARGTLVCGVSQGIPGFSSEEGGAWFGFDVDFCRAVAAAIFADPQKVQFVPLSTSERFEALTSKKIDLLSRNSTWTMGREAELGISFAAITYYDGQGFLVPRARGVTTALELDGSKVCAQAGTTSEANAADFFQTNNMNFEPVPRRARRSRSKPIRAADAT